MANPQPDKYTKISNELMENMPLFKFNGTQLRIMLIVIRYTYGFSRKEHEMSLSFISKATQIHREQIKKELTTLIEKNVLTVVRDASFNSTRILKLNKDYDKWEVKKSELKGCQVANSLPGSEKDYTTGSELDPCPKKEKDSSESSHINSGEETIDIPGGGSGKHPQERNIKDNIKEKSIDDFFNQIWALYPLKKGKSKVSNSSKKELYRISYEELARAIERYKKYVSANSWMKYQHGSTFFNSGYIDYLDENYTEEDQSEAWGWNR